MHGLVTFCCLCVSVPLGMLAVLENGADSCFCWCCIGDRVTQRCQSSVGLLLVPRSVDPGGHTRAGYRGCARVDGGAAELWFWTTVGKAPGRNEKRHTPKSHNQGEVYCKPPSIKRTRLYSTAVLGVERFLLGKTDSRE